MQRSESGIHLRQARGQPLHLRARVGRLTLGVGGGTLRVVLDDGGFELLLAGPLRRFTRRGERRLGGGELGERSFQRRSGTAAVRLRVSHFLRQRFQLGAPLEGSPTRHRRSREEHGAVGPA